MYIKLMHEHIWENLKQNFTNQPKSSTNYIETFRIHSPSPRLNVEMLLSSWQKYNVTQQPQVSYIQNLMHDISLKQFYSTKQHWNEGSRVYLKYFVDDCRACPFAGWVIKLSHFSHGILAAEETPVFVGLVERFLEFLWRIVMK